ncbi:MAG: transcription antitermination factor NusB [Alphaproteobacteria bacterium]
MTDAAAPSGLAARRAALTLLVRQERARPPLDQMLERAESDGGALAGLPPAERAFARRLVLTVLRRYGEINFLLRRFMERPLPGEAAEVRAALRLGLAQLLFLEVPPHAAVDTSVRLIRTGPAAGQLFAGLVNAILRRAGREGASLLTPATAARRNTPPWLWQSWAARWDEATATSIAAAHLVEPPLDLTPRDAAATPTLATQLAATILPTGSLRLMRPGAIGALPGYDTGQWWVQDAAAALPARLLGDVAGQRIADLCAAPGGKTLQLAAAGGRVTAVDRDRGRLDRLAANLARTGLAARLVTADLLTTDTAAWAPRQGFDSVLLDAPCTATGTLRRHPDIAGRRSAADVAERTVLQAELLRAAARLVRPGGRLVYTVCSLQAEEGPDVISAFLRADRAFARRPIGSAEVGGEAAFISPQGDLTTLPCHWSALGGLDGFYAARLVRTAA